MQTGREFAQVSGGGVVASLIGAFLFFITTAAVAEGPLKSPGSQLEPMKWNELSGWTADDHLAAFAAYQTSCQALLKTRRSEDRGELSAALSSACRKAAGLVPKDTESARAFFEQNFQPVRIGRLGEAEGLLTGYFEPIVAGSRFPTPEFHIPLYRRPGDLVAAGYKPGSLAFPNKGARIGRLNEKNEIVPYHDRAAIEAGALDGQKLEICWLKSSSDLLAIQIEGSGRVNLEDGTPLRVSFDSHNGYAFSSIERVLIDRNIIPRKEISTQSIRDWMAAHPEEAAKVRAANRSYVFPHHRAHERGRAGRRAGRAVDSGPLDCRRPGASIRHAVLHRGRSAVRRPQVDLALPPPDDRAGHGIGDRRTGPRRSLLGRWRRGRPHRRPHSPSWPLCDAVAARPRPRRGRPRGAAAGAKTDRHARSRQACQQRQGRGGRHGRQGQGGVSRKRDGRGRQKDSDAAAETEDRCIRSRETGQQGKVESVGTPAAAAGRKTLSPPNTKIAALEAGKQDGKGKANSAGASARGKSIVLPVLKPKSSSIDGKKQDGKGKAESAGASASEIAAGSKQKPSLVSKSKTPEIEARKKDAKGKVETVGASSSATAAAGKKPSPAPKSKTSETEVKKQSGKGKEEAAGASEIAAGSKQKPSKSKTPEIEARKQDAKGKVETVGAGSSAIAAGLHKSSLGSKSKTFEIGARKQDAKGKAKSATSGTTLFP
jgi:membrane-bound lytic murein transglycosylase